MRRVAASIRWEPAGTLRPSAYFVEQLLLARSLVSGRDRVARLAQEGSQRQPSLSSQVIASPSPATPETPWSAARQNSPGS
jgi:hypothetical protein